MTERRKNLANPVPSSGFSFGNSRRKDPRTVFVAGATGQAGIRIAQMLLRKGFTVRAAVPDLGSSFDDAESIAKAIGNASKVVVTVGPAENGPTSEVTLEDPLQVLQASQLAGVDHVAIIYDGTSGASKTMSNVLYGISSFFNNLFTR
ncbi:hypothetical protein BVC80_7763g6 [Macleaya cordata]|uniref:NAD(P)-binding domain-containing protein n=1 Tax=Macleaya cordata TaxID=56857 RepID=A0A200QG60_MACCD|nr:hypothetical protein BVC80_7763g6 [Macleaya cordata]